MLGKLFKCVFLLGVLAAAAIVALQFQPVRDAVKEAGFDI